MRSVVLIFALGILLKPSAQQVNWKKIEGTSVEKILHSGPRKPIPVLLLGTFHFGYPNLDAHKTDSSKYVDVLSAARQQELQELVSVIERFKPTRVYIESKRNAFHDSLYAEYLQGHYTLERNEVFQLGYRIAKDMKQPRIYPVDAGSFAEDYSERFPLIDTMFNRNAPVDSVRDKYWNRLYSKAYAASDSMATQLTMLENFLWMAQPANQLHLHGNYLSGGFNTTNDDGPDVMSTWWYNRNLRIFNRILQTKPADGDRILVIFGNGHMPLLRHCFGTSPEFSMVELKSLLK